MTPKSGIDSNLFARTSESDLLPRDIFSKCSYVVFNYKLFSALLALELLVISLLLCSVIRSRADVITTLAVGIPVMTTTGLIAYFSTRDYGLTEMNKLVFLKELTVTKPGVENEKWEALARRLNPIFYENSRSATPYFFYDGEACASCFKRNFLKPYYFRTNGRDVGEETTESSGPSEANGLPNKNHQIWHFRSELDPFIELAVKAYEESLTAYWNEVNLGNAPSQ